MELEVRESGRGGEEGRETGGGDEGDRGRRGGRQGEEGRETGGGSGIKGGGEFIGRGES